MQDTRRQIRALLTGTVAILMASVLGASDGAASGHSAEIARFNQGEAPLVLAFDPIRELVVETGSAVRKRAGNQAELRPVGLAAGDLDGDGAVDLIVARGGDESGVLEVFLGNPEVRLPVAARSNKAATQPFSSLAAVHPVGVRPDLVVLGDYDADGLRDVLVAQRGRAELVLLPGTGRAGFGPARTVRLDGAVTSLASGEIHRHDGLADIAVGIDGAAGPQLVVFRSHDGAFEAPPEIFALPSAAREIVTGQLDGDPTGDVAAICGDALAVLRGVDARPDARTPTIDVIELGSAGVSLVAGDFEGDPRDELAVLDAGGFLRTYDLRSSEVEVGFVHLAKGSAIDASLGVARFSGRRYDDLMVVDRNVGRAELYSSEELPGDVKTVGGWTPLGEITAPAGLTELLAVPVDFDAFDDLVILGGSTQSPGVALRKTLFTYTVNQLGDEDDGACTHAHCTLREAINAANATPAVADTIQFTVGTSAISPVTALPIISGPVVIDGAQSTVDAPAPDMTVIDASSLASGNGLVMTSSSSSVTWLAIGGAPQSGLVLVIGGGSVVSHCHIGVGADGATAQGNDIGLEIGNSSGNTIGGVAAADRNVISGNTSAGMRLVQSSGTPANTTQNVIIGNRIGTNSAGDAAVGNGVGVLLDDVADNDVGSFDGGNLISGNVGDGVVITGTGSANDVFGNLIGTTMSGSSALGNGGHGVSIEDSPWTQVGGSTAALRNIISGNDLDGVHFEGPDSYGLWVRGNYIGTSADGVGALGNDGDGVEVVDGMLHQIGGDGSGQGNVISGNAGSGVVISESWNSNPDYWPTVRGNLIGTDATGFVALANGSHGVFLDNGDGVLIGGGEPGQGNVISGNRGSGIYVDNHTTSVDIQGNFIGTGLDGVADLGNTGRGVFVGNGCHTILVGVDLNNPSPAGNTIAFNGGAGVFVFGTATSPTQVTANEIHSNGGLGIDLGDSGVTLNDPGDPDTGPNELLNFPVLTSVVVIQDHILVEGFVDTDPSYSLSIDLYANRSCDPAYHGEGQEYITSTGVSSYSGGSFSGQSFPISPLTPYVTAVATVRGLPTRLGPTSEFSLCVEATFEVVIFADGFEDGTASAWAEVVP